MTFEIFLHSVWHGLKKHLDNDMRRWYSDGIGKVYTCTCGRRWYR